MARLSFTFWGTRGSLPSAGTGTTRYGGNTPCLEVRCDDQLYIVDMGSGLRPFGASLGSAPIRATLLMTHYHYDHIQGLPFFGPVFNPQNRFDILGPSFDGKTVREVLSGQLIKPYFPVGLEVLQANLEFRTIESDQTLAFGSTRIKTHSMYHPGGSLAFRFEVGGASLAYCTDVEHDDGPRDQQLIRFIAGVDTVIVDAMYTPDEYAGKIGPSRAGFGHSTYAFATRVAREGRAKNLILCHHDPGRSDEQVDGLVKLAREQFPRTTAAQELLKVEVG
jgi:phosphoribosyl 1,2-cyclic phosphodiesterase